MPRADPTLRPSAGAAPSAKPGGAGGPDDGGASGPAAEVPLVRVSRPRLRRILGLALPIVGGMVSQNVLNLVDAAMVGRVPDATTALAAVGMGSFLTFLAGAFLMGLGAGVQAIAARRVGEGRRGECALPLNGGLLLSLGLGLPLSVVLASLAPAIFRWLVDDPQVIAQGTPYLQARLLALAAVGANFSFRGYWNATDRSALYMSTLVVMHSANIALNGVLIFGAFGVPAMGAPGAGVASAIATGIGTGTYLALGLRHGRREGFLVAFPSREGLRRIVALSVPAGLQQSFFAAGMVVFMWIVGQVGTPQMAASHVILQLLLVAMLPALGFGLASASLVGQALGRGGADDARRWGFEVVRVSSLVVGVIALPAMVLPELPLRLFLTDPATLAIAAGPMRLVALSLPVDATGAVLMNGLYGAGASRRVMVTATVLQWGLGLPLAYLVGPVLGLGLLAVWGSYAGYRLVQSLVFLGVWRTDTWTRHAV